MTKWEIERDRHGLLFSGPIEVGECIEVMPVTEHQARVAELEEGYRYILGEDVAGYDAHMRPDEVARRFIPPADKP